MFDVGANDGRTALRVARHFPAVPRIFAFEPVSATFRTLVERTADLPGIECFQLALGTECGPRTMYLNDISALNSLSPEMGTSGTTEQVEMQTLDNFVEQKNIEKIHLLKIDAEGHDLDVLKGAERSLAQSRVDIIQIEAGFSVPGNVQTSLDGIQQYLKSYDYYLRGIYNQCHGRIFPATGASQGKWPPEILVYCDAVFVSVRSAVGKG